MSISGPSMLRSSLYLTDSEYNCRLGRQIASWFRRQLSGLRTIVRNHYTSASSKRACKMDKTYIQSKHAGAKAGNVTLGQNVNRWSPCSYIMLRRVTLLREPPESELEELVYEPSEWIWRGGYTLSRRTQTQ